MYLIACNLLFDRIVAEAVNGKRRHTLFYHCAFCRSSRVAAFILVIAGL